MSGETATLAAAGRTAWASRRPGRAITAGVVAAAVLVGATCLALMATNPDSGDAGTWSVELAANLFTIGVGLVMWHARPGNRVGPLVILMGFAGAAPFLSWASGNGVAWTIGDMWNLLGVVVLANVYLAFPEGRTSGWSRHLVIAVYAWFFLLTVGQRLVQPYPSSWAIRNPLLLWPNEGLADSLGMVANLGALVLTILVVGTVLDRWRRGSPVARRALAPVFWVSPITLVVNGTFFVARVIGSDTLFAVSTGPLAQLSNFLLPIAFLVGLLQTRLERGSIADLVRDLDGVRTGDLEASLARAVHDPTLRLAFPTPDDTGYVDPTGRSVEVPAGGDGRDATRIEGSGRTIAILIHDPAVDPGLVGSAAAASRLALENERLAAELRAHSRRSERRGRGSSRRPTRSGGGSSATCTMGPSSGSWPSASRSGARTGVPMRTRSSCNCSTTRTGNSRTGFGSCVRSPAGSIRPRSQMVLRRRSATSPIGSRSRSRSTSRTGGSRRRSRRPLTSSSPRP